MRRVTIILFLLVLASPAVAAAAIAAPVSDALSDAANQAYLKTNAARTGVVTRPDGLQYRILANGFGKRPGATDTVRLVYSGKLINGAEFDGASPGLPASLAVNALIRGLNEAVQLMHEGDRWQLVIPSSLGFGAAGAANGAIPPNQTLMFDVTLVSVLAAPSAAQVSSGLPFGVTASSQGREEQGHAVLTIPQ